MRQKMGKRKPWEVCGESIPGEGVGHLERYISGSHHRRNGTREVASLLMPRPALPTVSLALPRALSPLAHPPRTRWPRWALGPRQSPALPFAPVSLGKQARPPLLLCFRKAFQFGKANTAKEKGNTLQKGARPPEQTFLGLLFNFLHWPPAKNVSCDFSLCPSPPSLPTHPRCL